MSNINANVRHIHGGLPESDWEIYYDRQRQAIIGRLTSNLVHEINNPMQAIQGSASLALEDLTNTSDLQEYLQLIQHESSRVLALTALMRSLYFPNPSEIKKIRLDELMQHLMLILKDDLNQKGLSASLLSPVAPIFVLGNEQGIQIGLLNLLLTLNAALQGQKSNYSISFQSDQNTQQCQIEIQINNSQDTNLKGIYLDPTAFKFSAELIHRQKGKITYAPQQKDTSLKIEFAAAG